MYQNTEACLAYEYGHPTSELNAAVIDLSGRYPDDGWALNTACTALIHVMQGRGELVGDGAISDLAEGDQVLITPNEPYAFDGTMKLLYISTPAWTPEQAKHVE